MGTFAGTLTPGIALNSFFSFTVKSGLSAAGACAGCGRLAPFSFRLSAMAPVFLISAERNGMSKNSVASRIDSKNRTIMTRMAPTKPRYFTIKSENANPTIPPSRNRKLFSVPPHIEKRALDASMRKNVPKILKYNF